MRQVTRKYFVEFLVLLKQPDLNVDRTTNDPVACTPIYRRHRERNL